MRCNDIALMVSPMNDNLPLIAAFGPFSRPVNSLSRISAFIFKVTCGLSGGSPTPQRTAP